MASQGNSVGGGVFGGIQTTQNTPPANTPSGGSSTGSGGTAWTALINGDTLSGLGNLVSAFTGKGNPNATTYIAPTPAASNNSIWMILGVALLIGLLIFIFMRGSVK